MLSLLLLAAQAGAAEKPRAMWHWDASAQFASAAAQADFFDFCRRENVDRVWLQVSATPPPRVRLRNQTQLRRFVKEATRRGIAVEALDGRPEIALRENHAASLGLVEAVAAFNAAGALDERLAGVHLDNEPYLLVGWNHPKLRQEILREYVELNEAAQQRARAAKILFGVDLPSWWKFPDFAVAPPGGGEPLAVGLLAVERLDEVGLMNYRTAAQGEDGMVGWARELLAHAERTDGARVYAGVETFQPGPSDVWFTVGRTRAEFERALEGPARALARTSRWHGFPVHVLDDGTHVHVGLERTKGSGEGAFRKALAEVEELAGFHGPAAEQNARRAAALAALRKERAEWSEARESPGGFRALRHMLDKITFAKTEPAAMKRVLAEADAAFQAWRPYAGIALHFYETYRQKVDGR